MWIKKPVMTATFLPTVDMM